MSELFVPAVPATRSTSASESARWRWAARLLAFSVLIPLAVILGSWLFFDAEVWSHLGSTVLPQLMVNTFWLVTGVGVGTLLLGVSLAWLTVMCDFPGRRILDWALMLPRLFLTANVIGILGGMGVGVGMLDIGFIQYYNETVKAVNLWNLGIGLFSGTVFGVIVALSGCMRGMQCGRSASAVGEAATSAVVTAIVGIILSTALITVLCNLLGI